MSIDHSSPAGECRDTQELAAIAQCLVRARLQALALHGFPGKIPADLVAAYRVQDLAIAQWPDTVGGWKVGYIPPECREASGAERLLGPVFARTTQLASGSRPSVFQVFSDGFGAVEAEYILRLDADAPTHKTDWTSEEAGVFPSTLFVGMEVASSPLATINQLGPCVVVSDFGNNNGLIVGPQVRSWPRSADAGLTCQTFIDSLQVGAGGAATLPGGLRAAFAFALSHSARRGRPLKAGELIATGNATGVHNILPGQEVRIHFDGHGDIVCRAVAAAPVADGETVVDFPDL